MANYFIQSKLGGGLVVSVDEAGFLILDTQVAGNPDQMWEFEPIAGQEGNYKIKHVGTGLYVLYSGVAEGGQLVLFAGDQGETQNQNFYVWNTSSSHPFTDEFIYLRINSNHWKNWNAAGDHGWGPGTRIITYGWQAGGQNELWHLQEAKEPGKSTMSRYIDIQKFFNAISPFITNNENCNGFTQSQLFTSTSAVTYGDTAVTPTGRAIYETLTTVTNNSNESNQETARVTTEQSSTYSYSTSISIKTSYSVQVSGTYGFGGVTDTFTLELNDTNTWSNSETKTRTFENSMDVPIEAYSSKKCNVTLNEIITKTPWTSQARIYGNVVACGNLYSPAQVLKGDPRFTINEGSADAYATIGGFSIFQGGNNFNWIINPGEPVTE